MPIDDEVRPDLPSETPDVTVNEVNDNTTRRSTCSKCGQPSSTFCPRCGQDFCATHQCIMHSQEFAVESAPLVDEDGVGHQGRHINLIGQGWPNSLRMIKDYTDDELRTQIKGLQDLLADAIRTADYARISIAAREFEVDYREHSRYVAAVKRREKIEQGAIRLNSKKYRKTSASAQIPQDILQIMKAYNVTQQQAAAVKILLGVKK